jgi:hypothetical protein
MKKHVEVLLVVLALAGLYSAIPATTKAGSQHNSSGVRAEQTVMVAEGDGTDPMPLCRKGHCNE